MGTCYDLSLGLSLHFFYGDGQTQPLKLLANFVVSLIPTFPQMLHMFLKKRRIHIDSIPQNMHNTMEIRRKFNSSHTTDFSSCACL
jgi:hypothetical protein